MRSKSAGETEWVFFNYDPLTLKTILVKFEGDKIHFRESIPLWLAQQMMEENKLRAKEFDASGGWKAKQFKKGAVIASVPHHIDQQFKKAAGYDPTKGGWYDKDKYNSFLDDSDYAYLRTGGGKIGKKKAEVVMNPKKLKRIIGV